MVLILVLCRPGSAGAELPLVAGLVRAAHLLRPLPLPLRDPPALLLLHSLWLLQVSLPGTLSPILLKFLLVIGPGSICWKISGVFLVVFISFSFFSQYFFAICFRLFLQNCPILLDVEIAA